jgi:hypothetical protein
MSSGNVRIGAKAFPLAGESRVIRIRNVGSTAQILVSMSLWALLEAPSSASST